MTFILSLPLFMIICFSVYYDYMLSIVSLYLYIYMESYSTHSMDPWVGGKHGVSMVLIQCFPAIALYIPGHVVDRSCDITIESFVVHSPNVELLVEHSYYFDRLTLFLIYLSNTHHV